MDPPIAVVGIPFDQNSSFMKGAAQGPEAIRSAFHSPSSNYFTESVRDLSRGSEYIDHANLPVVNYPEDIENGIDRLLEKGSRVISLGGDHSITYPIIKSFSKRYPTLHLLQLDAHPDLYPEFEGNRFSHACPFARILEDSLVSSLTQIGIRTMSQIQLEQAVKYDVKVYTMVDWLREPIPNLEGPLYLSLDLDVLDPAFAPGVSHHEPGGLSTREVIQIIQSIKVPLVGADIVELNPSRDHDQVTAMVAAKFLKEILDNMLRGGE